MWFSFLSGDKLTFRMSGIVLSRPVNVVLGIVKELDPMRDPACHSGNCEKDGIHIGGETHCSVDQA